ncbi:hypothetical protein M407DRAFT_32991 [Tulasnella calospora MUT 4182]|uniref:Protein kinase domain-containing protein n=1 Tax=Tulasnella calospora MUT 4182 TaxID=1051891 RepID=A0A0C3PRT4_9AGAM|nr:hypothetical protein M407DRAFT_32991 [Tulasnella calospora MUT 4182]
MSRPIDGDTVMEDGSHHADADIRSSAGFEPSVRLRARIEKLAHWRVNPCSVAFYEGAPEFHGGHATVSAGYMNKYMVEMRQLEKRALGKKLDRKAIHDFLRVNEKRNSLGLRVAVKRMRVADDTDFERVLGLAIREADFLAGTAHRNIVELEGFVEDVSESTIWLVFPWADNGNLRDFIASYTCEIPERISLIDDVAQGLAYLHSRDAPICHGDLKSLNVLIYNEEEIYAKITDFGSARRLSKHDPNINTHAESQAPPVHSPSVTFNTSTKTITLTGNKYTLRWAAPELLLNDQLSLWSDIWALGWIAYEARLPNVTSDIGVVERVVEGKLPSLANDGSLALIHELCSLMEMCWKMKPTERPTAESCRRTINEMPKLAPAMFEGLKIDGSQRLWRLGQIYQSRGEYGRAFNLSVKAFERTREFGARSDIISMVRDLTQLGRGLNHYSETIALYDVIWKIYSEGSGDDFDDIANALCDLAELHRLRNKHDKALQPHSEGRETQEEERMAEALCKIAQQYRLADRHDKAIQLYTRAWGILTDLGDRKGQADALWGLANAHQCRGESDKAIPLYSDAWKIRTDLGDKKGQADALWCLADAHRCLGDYDKATPLYSRALEIRTDLDDRLASSAVAMCMMTRIAGRMLHFVEKIGNMGLKRTI